MVRVHADLVALLGEGVLAVLDRPQLVMRLQVRPAPESTVNHVRQTLAADTLNAVVADTARARPAKARVKRNSHYFQNCRIAERDPEIESRYGAAASFESTTSCCLRGTSATQLYFPTNDEGKILQWNLINSKFIFHFIEFILR